MQGAQSGAGFGAEAFGEGAAGALVGGQGVGVAAGGAQGVDEEGVQRFVVRVGGGQFTQPRYGVVEVAEAQTGLDTGAGRLQVQGLGTGGVAGEVGEGGAAPESECLVQVPGGGRGVAVSEGGGALAHEALEDEQVDVVAGRREPVTAGGGFDGLLADGTAEAADQCLEGGRGVLRRVVPRPDLVDQRGGRDDVTGAQGEGGEQRAQAGAAGARDGAVVLRLGDAQDSVPHGVIVAARMRCGHPARVRSVIRGSLAPGVGVGAGVGTRTGVAGCRCAHPCRPSGTTARSQEAWRRGGRAAYGEQGTCRGVSARSGWRVNAPSLFK
ncbi:hypothetical protein RKD37_004926 [Streptomyces ambofaciens]